MPFLCGHITHSAIMFLPTRSKITSFMSEWNISCVLCAWSDCSYFPVSWTVFLVITQLLPSKNCSSYKDSVYILIGLRIVAVRKISTLPFQIFPLIGFFKLLQSESWWDFAKNDSDPTDYDKIPWSFIVAMFKKIPSLMPLRRCVILQSSLSFQMSCSFIVFIFFPHLFFLISHWTFSFYSFFYIPFSEAVKELHEPPLWIKMINVGWFKENQMFVQWLMTKQGPF